jgi:RND superfamily putative drug exporter
VTTTVTGRTAQQDAARHAAGLLSRLGAWTGSHLRIVLIAWLLVLGVFGAFAPQVESALSGAGWQDSGSSSVKARDVIAKNFAGLNSTALQVVVHDSRGPIAEDPAAQQVIARATALLQADPRVRTVVTPRPGSACPETAGPRSFRPARRPTPTRWSAQPMTSRNRSRSCPPAPCRST